MPNWCSNKLSIVTGDHAAVEAIFGEYGDDFSLQTIQPCPQELKDATANGHAEYTIVYGAHWRRFSAFSWILDHLGGAPPTRRRVISAYAKHARKTVRQIREEAATTKRLIDGYGHADWYGWCIEHWGVKWDVTDVRYDGAGCWSFDTAWGPPRKAIITLSARFPNHVFHLQYEEPDMNFSGRESFSNGDMTDDLPLTQYY